MALIPNSRLPAPYSEGFGKSDPFGMAARAAALEHVLKQAVAPMVLALDGAWGSGKSHFLRRWTGEAERWREMGATVVYFDAFARDYLDDPLESLLMALVKRVAPVAPTFKERAVRLLPRVGKAAINIASFGAMRELGDLGDAIIEEVADMSKAAVDHAEKMWAAAEAREDAMAQFRAALEEMVGDKATPQKLVLIVDELDRCRPDYALRMLETIKHFFDVEHVHFVLGVNLDQLQHSVRAVYGPGFDAEKYLQRFVQVTMAMHMPWNQSTGRWAKAAAHYLHDLGEDEENSILCGMAERVHPDENLTYRDVERLHTLAKTVEMPQQFNEQVFQSALMLLSIARPSMFKDLREQRKMTAALRRFFQIGDGGAFWTKSSKDRSTLSNPVYLQFCADLLHDTGEEVPGEVRNRFGLDLPDRPRLLTDEIFRRISAFSVS